ncbi:MAG: hypothetical protein CBHOC_5161 [uncultured Caballeronia sp.]|nr:MAG: hypothetical protein CBHOC_5161 [uncultured Caballeronia sp.]
MTAVSLPAPSDTGPLIVPPLHVIESAPKVVVTPCPIEPPVIVSELVPLPRSTRPPIVPPESVNVSSFCAALTLPSICPPDMPNTLLPTFRSTLPMRPPDIVNTSRPSP